MVRGIRSGGTPFFRLLCVVWATMPFMMLKRRLQERPLTWYEEISIVQLNLPPE